MHIANVHTRRFNEIYDYQWENHSDQVMDVHAAYSWSYSL